MFGNSEAIKHVFGSKELGHSNLSHKIKKKIVSRLGENLVIHLGISDNVRSLTSV